MWWVLGPDGRTPPTKDKRVREAMNLALDRAEIAAAIFAGKADPAAVPLGLSWSFKDVGFKVTPEMAYPYDPARAKKLLADAGVASGSTWTSTPTSSRGSPRARPWPRRWRATGRRSASRPG